MDKTLIIAEAGVNHNGSMDIAMQLIDVAAGAGVDYVKFQTFQAEKIASKHADKAAYQKDSTGSSESQLAMLKNLELTEDEHVLLKGYCEQKGVKFLSTAFDLESIDLLCKLKIRLGKIPSGEITNLPYLRKMATSFDELILSSGMSDLKELDDAFQAVMLAGAQKGKIKILHCNTEYPTPFKDVNLRAMQTIREKFEVQVGYSDHTQGIEVPIAAVALGATVIEKHFTLSRLMKGPDHKASLEPGELKQMVSSIRNIELALGSRNKLVTESEAKNKTIARKSIVAAVNIRAGEIFSEKNLAVKRPGTGISPMLWDSIIGKSSKRDFLADEAIEV